MVGHRRDASPGEGKSCENACAEFLRALFAASACEAAPALVKKLALWYFRPFFVPSSAHLLWTQRQKRRGFCFAWPVLPEGIGTPAVGVKVAAEIAPLLVGAPVIAQFDLG